MSALRPPPAARATAIITAGAATTENSQPIQSQHHGTDRLVPGEKDVLCGRGCGSNQHPGNQEYRALIQDRKLFYNSVAKFEKQAVSKAIVAAIQADGGRFLQPRQVELEMAASGTTTLWCEIGDPKAIEKTSQALREKRFNTCEMGDPNAVEKSSQALREKRSKTLRTTRTKDGDTAALDVGPETEEDTEDPDRDRRSRAWDDAEVIVPRHQDIICGPQSGSPGTVWYRTLLERYMHKHPVLVLHDKHQLAWLIYQAVRGPYRGGVRRRFLQQHRATERWYEMSADTAMTKIRRAVCVTELAVTTTRQQQQQQQQQLEQQQLEQQQQQQQQLLLFEQQQKLWQQQYSQEHYRHIPPQPQPPPPHASPPRQQQQLEQQQQQQQQLEQQQQQQQQQLEAMEEASLTLATLETIEAVERRIQHKASEMADAVAAVERRIQQKQQQRQQQQQVLFFEQQQKLWQQQQQPQQQWQQYPQYSQPQVVNIPPQYSQPQYSQLQYPSPEIWNRPQPPPIPQSKKSEAKKRKNYRDKKYRDRKRERLGAAVYKAQERERYHRRKTADASPPMPQQHRQRETQLQQPALPPLPSTTTVTTATTMTMEEEETTGIGDAFASLVHRVCLTHPHIPGGTAQLRIWLERYRPQYRSLEASPHDQRLLLDTIVRHVVRHVARSILQGEDDHEPTWWSRRSEKIMQDYEREQHQGRPSEFIMKKYGRPTEDTIALFHPKQKFERKKYGRPTEDTIALFHPKQKFETSQQTG